MITGSKTAVVLKNGAVVMKNRVPPFKYDFISRYEVQQYDLKIILNGKSV